MQICLVLDFILILTQTPVCSWDVGPHSQGLQAFQVDCFPNLAHPSNPVSPSHDGQHPKFTEVYKI